MSYESAVDPVVSALRAMAIANTLPALALVFGDVASYPAIRSTRGAPFTLEMIEGAQLPMLCVHVVSEREAMMGKKRDAQLTVVFEYIGPQTPLQKIDARWPMLRTVWRQLVEDVIEGSVQDAPGLDAVGVVQVDYETAAVEYDYATDGEQAYPYFRGTIGALYRPPTDTAELADYLEMHARIYRDVPGDGDAANAPRVEFIARTPEGAAAHEAEGDALDDDSEDS